MTYGLALWAYRLGDVPRLAALRESSILFGVALAWLVNELSCLGITLQAGQVVTTGTCVIPLPIEPGDTLTADFGTLGNVTARFSQ